MLIVGPGRPLNLAGGLLEKLNRRGRVLAGNVAWAKETCWESDRHLGNSRDKYQSFGQHGLKLCPGVRRDCTFCQGVASPPLPCHGWRFTHLSTTPRPTAHGQPGWRRVHVNTPPLTMSLSHCGPCPLSVNYLMAVPSPLATLSPRG